MPLLAKETAIWSTLWAKPKSIISIASSYVIVGRVILQPGKHIFFLFPILPSFWISTVTKPFSIFLTIPTIDPSAIKICLPIPVALVKFW